MSERLSAQIAFLKRADMLKTVERANVLLDQSRPENSAEHSWHLALWAMVMAPLAGPDVSIDRVIRMLLLHDLVEIVVGDHPIHLETDWDELADAEQNAASQLFGLLPEDQAHFLLSLWQEFEADQTPDARFAKVLDRCQPLFQVLCASDPKPDHVDIARANLDSGRAAYLSQVFPLAYRHASDLLNRSASQDNAFTRRLDFLTEADQLKSVIRASRLIASDRLENSAEHSWHIMLYAWVLSEHAHSEIRVDRVLQMLLLHDIVEIDAGDHPIHGQVNHAEQEAKEQAAAERLFGLLPDAQQIFFTDLWREFEACESADARFAKSVDRFQTPIANLENGGGSWIEYNVTFTQLEARVGPAIRNGAPDLWNWLYPMLVGFFDSRETTLLDA
ncbi:MULTISPECIES: HD domain-containing protein [unclassified Ruegeria]|uniref:HD domain-containing protein n=1 Tax=unclassified Ruegeria TaxID=2625375 RepID=UPI001489075B|nr:MULTISPECIES: HD domain-containing protein [unclassified Ruegeria]NOD63367.1 HD domain-containing protein [Ruegeria sp. HKCCD6109]